MHQITTLRRMSREEVRSSVSSFSRRYAQDWDAWLGTPSHAKALELGRTLRRWQAVRARLPRRARADRMHAAPYPDDLLEAASGPLADLDGLSLETMPFRTGRQTAALSGLWDLFEGQLALDGRASCVGISKASMLMTVGRIGPSLDSNVRGWLGIGHVLSAREWIDLLTAISVDIAAFEERNGSLRKCVPSRYAGLEYGRLYDMVFGPRDKTDRRK